MITFTHPCGHADEIDERQWYENGGDAPWGCPICEKARQKEREANASYLLPLHTFLKFYAPICARMGYASDEPYGDWEPDPMEKQWRTLMASTLEALRVQTIMAMDTGLSYRAQQVADQRRWRSEPHMEEKEPLDLEELLRQVEVAYDRMHNPLWCAENGVQSWEGSEAFWLFDVERAEERLVAEMWRRSHA